MRQVTLAEAKTNFTELVTAAEHGEIIEIVRDGRVVVSLSAPVTRERKPLDIDALRALTEGTVPIEGKSAVQKLREDARY